MTDPKPAKLDMAELACEMCDVVTTIEKRCPYSRKPKPQEKPCKTALKLADRAIKYLEGK